MNPTRLRSGTGGAGGKAASAFGRAIATTTARGVAVVAVSAAAAGIAGAAPVRAGGGGSASSNAKDAAKDGGAAGAAPLAFAMPQRTAGRGAAVAIVGPGVGAGVYVRLRAPGGQEVIVPVSANVAGVGAGAGGSFVLPAQVAPGAYGVGLVDAAGRPLSAQDQALQVVAPKRVPVAVTVHASCAEELATRPEVLDVAFVPAASAAVLGGVGAFPTVPLAFRGQAPAKDGGTDLTWGADVDLPVGRYVVEIRGAFTADVWQKGTSIVGAVTSDYVGTDACVKHDRTAARRMRTTVRPETPAPVDVGERTASLAVVARTRIGAGE